MNFFLLKAPLPCLLHHTSTSPAISFSAKPRRNTSIIATAIPARDQVVDFGKYKGRMLGSLPSRYLKWASKNLRDCYSSEWADLAEEVLKDPIYRDRIEWEFADKVMCGNSRNRRDVNAAEQLWKISKRFGWDFEDKIGWGKVKLEFLGTSKSGRLPRKGSPEGANQKRELKVEVQEKARVLSEDDQRRQQRRERVRRKIDVENRKDKVAFLMQNGDNVENGVDDDGGTMNERKQGKDKDQTVKIYSPFPGREAFLKKALHRRRSF